MWILAMALAHRTRNRNGKLAASAVSSMARGAPLLLSERQATDLAYVGRRGGRSNPTHPGRNSVGHPSRNVPRRRHFHARAIQAKKPFERRLLGRD